jgi:hypothetical protein
MPNYAILCQVGKAPEIIHRPESLADMQAAVGGYIDCLELATGIDLWCNDEGLYTCEPNRLVCNRVPIHGDFFICGNDGRGESRGLTATECIEWLVRASEWPMPLQIPKGRN